MTPRFRVFVSGRTLNAKRAVNGVRQAGLEVFGVQPDLEVVDVLEQPALADAAKVITIPTVVRLEPAPSRTFIGDLANARLLSDALERDQSNPRQIFT